MRVDHFFQDDERIVAQGYDFTTSVECNQFRSTDDATIRAIFVQFNDGSIWGDGSEAKHFAVMRQDAIDYLKELQSVPDLKKAVSKRPIYDAKGDPVGPGRRLQWFHLFQEVQEGKTSEDIAQDIQDRLDLAAKRKAWLDATKDAAKVAEAKKPPQYVIKVSDTLRVMVVNRTDLTKTQPVRDDGKISLPLLNDVQAAGLTPRELAAFIREKLKRYMEGPTVTVVVDGMNPQPKAYATVPDLSE